MRDEGGARSAGGRTWARNPTGSRRERPRPRGPAPSMTPAGPSRLSDLEGLLTLMPSSFDPTAWAAAELGMA